MGIILAHPTRIATLLPVLPSIPTPHPNIFLGIGLRWNRLGEGKASLKTFLASALLFDGLIDKICFFLAMNQKIGKIQ
jgi:hypothetical protein